MNRYHCRNFNLKDLKKTVLSLLCIFMLIQLSQPAAYAVSLENDKIRDTDSYGEDHNIELNEETPPSETVVVQNDKNVIIKEPEVYHEPQVYDASQEMIEKRTLNTKTYQLSEGHYATQYYFDDIFKEENGQLVEIDNTLEKRASLFSINDTEIYANKNGAFHFAVSNGVIELENEDGDHIEIIPSGNLNNYAVKENVILYSSIYEQTDLELRLGSHTMRMALILNTPLAENNYSFAIQSDLEYEENAESIDFMKEGQVIFSLYRPIMSDDEESFRMADYLIQNSDSEIRMTMQMDEEWLADEARIYPVTAASTMGINDEKRADIRTSYIRSHNPNVTSTYEHLFVGYDSGDIGGDDSDIGIARTFIYFPMPDIGSDQLITHASLKLYRIATGMGDGVSSWTTLQMQNTSYVDVNSVKWSNQPSNVTNISAPVDIQGGSGYKSFDITEHVRQLYQGEKKTLILKSTNETSNYHCNVFYSEKSMALPVLTILHEDDIDVDLQLELNNFDVEMHVHKSGSIKISMDGIARPNSTVLFDLYEKISSGSLVYVKQLTAESSQDFVQSEYDRLEHPENHHVNYGTALLSTPGSIPKKDTFYEYHVKVKSGKTTSSRELVSDGFMWYTLQLGDNIGVIARKYGIKIEEIKEDNQLTDAQLSALKEGDVLFLRFKVNNPKVSLNDYRPKPKISTYVAEYVYRGSSCSGTCTFGDPINTSTGNFYHESDDLLMKDHDDLKLTRFYNSYGDVQEGMFGKGFISNVESYIAYDKNHNLLIFWKDGKIFKVPYINGKYVADPSDEITVTKKTGNLIEVYDQDEKVTYSFNARGLLSTITTKEGFKSSIYYDDYARITYIMMGNKKLTFSYNSGNFVDAVTMPNGKRIRYIYDNERRLIEVVDALGYSEKYSYDKNGRMASITDKDGNLIARNTYDEKGRVLTQIDGAGNQLSVEYLENETKITYNNNEVEKYVHNEDLQVEKITQADGSYRSFKYDEHGDLIVETDELKRETKYSYNELHQLLKQLNYDDTEISYTYDSKGNLLSKTDIDGTQVTYQYDTDNRMISKTDAKGSITTMTYDANGRLQSETSRVNSKERAAAEITTAYEYTGNLVSKKTRSDGYWVSYQYDAMGNVTKETDSEGRIIYYAYDSSSRLIQLTDALGNTEQYAYDGRGNMITYLDKAGAVTSYTYDGNNQLIRKEKGTSFTEYEYDARQRIVKESDELGVKATYTYDGKGQKISETDRYGKSTAYEYDAVGNMVKMKDALGNQTVRVVENDLLVKETDEYGNITTYDYDDYRRIISLKNRYGTTSYEYDDYGNIIKVTDEQGITLKSYDEKNRLSQEISPKGVVSEYTYDSFDRILTKTVDGAMTAYTYDIYGNKLSETDPLGHTTSYEYDKLNRCIQETTSSGAITHHKYDAMDHEIETEDALGNKEKKVYDSYGNLIQEIDKAGYGITYAYNTKGQLSSTKDAKNVITLYTYDTYGNLKTIQIGNIVTEENAYDGYGRKVKTITPQKTMQWSYDSHGHVIEEKNVTKGLTITKNYDSQGRLITETDNNLRIQQYEYDSNDRLVKSTDAVGRVTSYVYDSYGREIEMSSSGQTTSKTYDKYDNVLTETDSHGNITSYTYDIMNRVVSSTDPKGIVTTNTYDEAGRIIRETDSFTEASQLSVYDLLGNLISQTDKAGNTTAYRYDAKSRVIQTTDAVGNTATKEYDIYDRVIKETDALGYSKQKKYDEFGNIVKETDERGFSVQYQYNDKLQVIKVTDKLGKNTTYAYDSHNNMVSQTNQNGYTTEYEYDIYGNITKITDPRGNITLKEYDILDQLAKETIPNKVTLYLHDDQGRLIEVKENGVTKQKLVYDSYDQIIEERDGLNRSKTYEYDEYGNIIKVNDRGYITEYDYDELNREVVKTENTDKITTTQYDMLNRVLEVEQNGHIREAYAYDAFGHITSELIDGVEVHHTRDALGRIIKDSYPTSEGYQCIWEYSYDEAGNQITQKDYLGNIKTKQYNANGMVIKEVDSNNAVTKYEYDSLNNLTKAENALEKVVSYEYDGNNNLIKKNIYERSAVYEYDANNYLIKETDEYGRVDSYTVDANGRVLTHTFNDGITVASTYDNMGNKLTEGGRTFTYDSFDRVVTAAYKGKTVTNTYDKYGNMTKVTDANGKMINYEWDIYGNKTKIAYDDITIIYEYDEKERMTTVKQGSEVKAAYEYDERGNAIKLTRETTVSTTLEPITPIDPIIRPMAIIDLESRKETVITVTDYDLLNRKTAITTKKEEEVVATYAYTYDGENNVLTETIDGNQNEYTYDALGELTYSKKYLNSQWVETSYTYDVWGNKEVVCNDGTRNYFRYNNGLLVSAKDMNISYNKRGNISGISYKHEKGEAFTYDDFGQLVKCVYTEPKTSDLQTYSTNTTPEKTHEYIYEYDAMGDRVASTKYTYSDQSIGGGGLIIMGADETNDKVIPPDDKTVTIKDRFIVDKSEEYSEIFGIIDKFDILSYNIYGNKERVYESGTICLNGINNSVYGKISNGKISKYEYTDYGEGVSAKNSSFGYDGELLDDNGLIYLRNRYYSPKLMQFIQVDSYKGEKESLLSQNRYSYCLNNPYKYIDKGGDRAISNTIENGGGKPSTKPSDEKPPHPKGNPTPRPSNDDATRANQKAKEAESRANNSRQPVSQPRARESHGNKMEGRYEPEDPDPCLWDKIVDAVARVASVTTLVLGIIALIASITAAAVFFPAVAPFIPAFGAALSTISSELVTASLIAGLVTVVTSFVQEVEASLGVHLDGTQMSDAEIVKKQNDAELNVTIAFIGVLLANVAYVINQFVNSQPPIDKVYSPKQLNDNMDAARIPRPDYKHAAHHIVAGNASDAKKGRDILYKFRIGINDAVNGVFLPTEQGVSDAAYHPSLHKREYYEKVNSLLEDANSREEVIRILRYIAEQLLDGTFMK